MPHWYPLIKAARDAGVAPWDMAGIPESKGCVVWIGWVEAAASCEAEAKYELQQRANRKK